MSLESELCFEKMNLLSDPRNTVKYKGRHKRRGDVTLFALNILTVKHFGKLKF